MDKTPKTLEQGIAQAIRLLARREHATRELDLKLRKRGYSADTIAEVTHRCRELGYLDDDRFASAYIRSLMRRGYGPFYIRKALRHKGLEECLVDQTMTTMAVEAHEIDGAEKALLKKLKNKRPSNDRHRQRAQLQGFLRRRGFSSAAIQHAMACHFSD